MIVPVGISFYVFMAISYTVDRYKKVIAESPSLVDFCAYISFFPHLLAGPIDRGREMLPQLQRVRTFDYGMAVDGMRQILCGLFKKVVIADNVASIVNNAWTNYDKVNSVVLVMAAVLYSIQIYADFSGYSDIAIGTGKLFGLQMRRNFAYPFFSRNVSEFWRGWHMSLTSWFTEYLYIPLGGNRKGTVLTIVNTLIVFTLCGFWHGANWTFLVWGFLCGAMFIPLLLSSRLKTRWKGQPVRLDAANLTSMLITFTLITACWIVFRAPSMADAGEYVSATLTNIHQPLKLGGHINFRALFLVLLMATVVVEWLGRNCEYPLAVLRTRSAGCQRVTYVVITLLVIMYATESGAFIYQNF